MKHITNAEGDCVAWCRACGPVCKHGDNSKECVECRKEETRSEKCKETQSFSFEEVLTEKIQVAIQQAVESCHETQETAVPKIVHALGTTLAVFAIHGQVSRDAFNDAAGSWYDMVASQTSPATVAQLVTVLVGVGSR